MKHFAMLTLVAATALTGVYAADLAPVKSTVKQVYVYQPEKYSVRQGGTISNQFNTYLLTVTVSKPMGNKPPQLQFHISAGNFGFNPLINPLRITVSDIALSTLSVKAEDFTAWKDGDKAGTQLKLNFDGSKYILISYMRPDSPVLWMTLKADPTSVEPTETLNIQVSNLTSNLVRVNKKTAWNGAYQREFITPTRTLKQQVKEYVLTPAENEITFTDKIFDGSAKDKGAGPTWFQFDSSVVTKATVTVRNEWVNVVKMTVKPDTKEFKFAYWQQKPLISNADFLKKLKEEKKAFTR